MVEKSTKIHTIVYELGNPISFLLSGGQIHDSKIVISLLETIDIHGSDIIADRAYGCEEISEYIIQHHATYVIPTQTQYKRTIIYGKNMLYRETDYFTDIERK